jgi:hypothetical protein
MFLSCLSLYLDLPSFLFFRVCSSTGEELFFFLCSLSCFAFPTLTHTLTLSPNPNPTLALMAYTPVGKKLVEPLVQFSSCSFSNWKKIGAGGLGVVWEAEWKDGGSMGLPPPKYAIKVIFPYFAFVIASSQCTTFFASASTGGNPPLLT